MARVELSRRKSGQQNKQSENSSPEMKLNEVKVSRVVVVLSSGIFKLTGIQLGISPDFS